MIAGNLELVCSTWFFALWGNLFAILAGNIFDVKMNIDGQTITASRYKGVLTFSENYVIVLQTLLLVHNGLHTNELSKRD